MTESLEYAIQPVRGVVIVTVARPLSSGSGILERIVADPLFRRGFNFVRDARYLTAPLDTPAIRAVADYLRAQAPQIAPCRWALVVPPHEDVYYGIGRMAGLMVGDCNIDFHVFRGFDSALSWAANEGELES